MHNGRSWGNKALCLLLALWMLCLCACHSAPKTEEEAGISYTDALGRTVVLPLRPQRVAALLGSFAEVWVLAGGELCAAAEDAFEDFGLEQGSAVNLGGAHSPGEEALLASEPQLVLASASTASHVRLQGLLEQAQIPVVYFDVDHFEDYVRMLELCTRLTGQTRRYETYGLAQQQRIDEIKARVKEGLSSQQGRILLLRLSSGSVKAKGREGTVLGEMLYDLGCENIADSQSELLEQLSLESVLAAEPYRIFAVPMGLDEAEAEERLRSFLEEHPAWGSLTAVKEGRVHSMDPALFHQKPNHEWALAYETLAQILLAEQ